MDLADKSFGRGNRELGGTRDLINQYRLWPYYEFFCKKPLPVSISETHYLHNVVGDTKVRKGEGMELDQLCQNPQPSEKKTSLSPFDLDVLSEAFHMREMSPFHLSSTCYANVLYTGQKGLLNAVLKSENQSRDHEKKKKKVNDKGENCKKQKHRLHRVNNGSCIENIRVKPHDPHPLQLKNHQNKKRKTDSSKDPSASKR
ncbi:probable mediator of RNA polymerase II transcription subunit 19b isoform X2 [Vigna unguiculata]|uniref:probable mediator of RNA polymerase II transcription subunit 19b isoform X2 n=1 Tax=Vigna unguiculata TaxID=3917 RepID=UPI0010166F67|nr:probable mediator of RNA polymerase II transcription subunit 19b isoform X2 [Vigna unguiculata]XP_027920930.1 probable mediator of RNA polymerase II transcription subunit 19b isoform X2 [Vigna unguiculata]XP_027920931.1 probable mediator of RNA polymerase II transcription subunit 19b isoform X2 [Vigna unguiculata]XP_027920932.1 probable mediator of RNA polymerase II transcription subunit 19b isoform X2 [Vigna unguiculata]XP_027920933.1 probable mediator of RNA polymerase II transcription sub